jgi:hypothetical protein
VKAFREGGVVPLESFYATTMEKGKKQQPRQASHTVSNNPHSDDTTQAVQRVAANMPGKSW